LSPVTLIPSRETLRGQSFAKTPPGSSGSPRAGLTLPAPVCQAVHESDMAGR
jgi:hypothetical protein